jgi:hypothetical protein
MEDHRHEFTLSREREHFRQSLDYLEIFLQTDAFSNSQMAVCGSAPRKMINAKDEENVQESYP